MKRGLTLVLALLIVAVFAFALTSCGGDEHEHTYSDKWTIDENYHWHVATCEHTDKISSKGGHVDNDGDGACDMCGNGEVHMHTYTDAWTSDETGHWHMATCEGHTTVKGDVYKHFNENGDGVCDLCGYAVCYSVEVNAPAVVDAPAVVYVDKVTGTATFEVSVSDLYVLTATGATQKGEVVNENGENVYTYELANVTADGEVTLASKQVGFVKLVSEDSVTLVLEEGWFGPRGSQEITLDLEAGTYAIVGTSEDDLEVTFMDADYVTVTELVVTEAGEVTVTLAATDYNYALAAGDEVEINYMVLSVPTTDVTMEELEGDGLTFPANVNMNLTFTAPEAGMYVFTSEAEGVVWNDDISICVAYAEEAGQELTVFVVAREVEGYSYEFDWKVEKLVPTGAFVNSESVTINYGEYTVLEFTAEEAGTYNFSTANMNTEVKYYNTEYGFMFNASWADMKLEAGDKVVLYVSNNIDEDYDGEDSITDTLVVDFKAALPSFTVTTTDTYTFFDKYTFTAEVSGSYTFYFPAGLGVWSVESFDGGAWAPDIVDFMDNTDGYEYTVDIAEGGTFEFYFGATTRDEFVIEYEVEEKDVEVGGGDEGDGEESTTLVAGANTITVTDDDKTIGVKEYTYTPEASGEHKFTGDFAVTILNGTSPVMGVSGYYTLEAGVEYTVQLGLGLVSVGTATLTIDAPQAAPSGNALQLGTNAGTANMAQAMSGVECTFTAPQTGTYAFETENINYMLMNGTFPMAQAIELEVGQTISFVAYLMGAGDYSITISISTGDDNDVADGSESNPYTLETLGELTFNSDTVNKVYYLYTATESGTLTITYPTADSWADCYEKVGEDEFDGENSQSSSEQEAAVFTVEAGKTYRIGIGTWAVSGETTVTITFVAE